MDYKNNFLLMCLLRIIKYSASNIHIKISLIFLPFVYKSNFIKFQNKNQNINSISWKYFLSRIYLKLLLNAYCCQYYLILKRQMLHTPSIPLDSLYITFKVLGLTSLYIAITGRWDDYRKLVIQSNCPKPVILWPKTISILCRIIYLSIVS